mmetsp:Transcript_15025/g.19027  ORF Transcript_15025/g.19027 Transcript_15025/m.19027 type:complete len:385 (-) Transcript_15025:115-1269(-)
MTADDNSDNTPTSTTRVNAGNSIVEVEHSVTLPLQKEMSSNIDTAIAAMDLSQDEDGSRSSSTSFAKEDLKLQIKDVTDYSRNSPVELQPDSPNEGLLRGWSQEEENDDNNNDRIDDQNIMNRERALKALKKGAVAVTGTALVVAGIPLIPMPTPGGVIVSGSGLALLATEFPAAQRVLDKSRDGLERMVGEEEDDSDDSDDENDDKLGSRKNKGYSKIVSQQEDNDGGDFIEIEEDCEEASLVSTRSTNPRERVDEIIRTTQKAGKRTKKNVKSFVRGTVLPLMARITTDKEEGSDNESTTSTSPTKRRGILRRKNSPKKDNPKKDSPKKEIPKKEEPKPLRTKNEKDTSTSDKSSTSFPVALPDITSTPTENEGTEKDIITN